ncbi:beta-glucosidase [Penicillium riverlandense]|uniref:beta-glucosidase n=1 Tax=Penicillium riverlandense TaxID=1903569 RepID=UPI002547FD2E|nr:beta-glucosidase [Penicillium riverlandense]KAJ5833794.1 beta-glucosidase [Penicillium riverlandense]
MTSRIYELQLTELVRFLALLFVFFPSIIAGKVGHHNGGSLTSTSESLPTVSGSHFSYTQVTTERHATPLPSPLKANPYGPHFHKASKLLPTLTYTTYSLDRHATATEDRNPYGQSAYAAMWKTYSYSSNVPFTTTMSPTPIPKSELAYPPQLYSPLPGTAAGLLSTQEGNASTECLQLPADFMWGLAGSAWQTEGGLMSEGRGPSVLDFIGALPNQDGLNDSVTANMHYFMYKQDIARLAAVGIPYYSFSISWTRVIPFGVAGSPVNTEALDHYDDVINTCLKHGITPVVTLLHDDSPINIDYDNATSFGPAFLYYAKITVAKFGDRVPVWLTYGEPNGGIGLFFKEYDTFRTLLLVHAEFYHWYRNVYQGTGQMSIKFANNLATPLRGPGSAADVHASLRYQDFLLGIMGNPLFLGQQYPTSVLDTPKLNLTPLTVAEIAYINGTCDFFALDPYVAQLATVPPRQNSSYESDDHQQLQDCIANPNNPLWPHCAEITSIQQNGWPMGYFSDAYSKVAPSYVRQQLGYVWNTFQPEGGIAITEFGFNPAFEAQISGDAQRFDLTRSLYLLEFLDEMLKAIYEDGVKMVGAFAWSLFDNNEFGSFAQQYGVQTVNRTTGTLERRYKRSMFDFVDFFHDHVAS